MQTMPGLTDEQEQKDLWKTLAVGMKNKLPILPLIIDSFSRDRIDYYQRGKGSLQLQAWVCYLIYFHILIYF